MYVVDGVVESAHRHPYSTTRDVIGVYGGDCFRFGKRRASTLSFGMHGMIRGDGKVIDQTAA